MAGLAGALYGHLFTFVNSGTFDLTQSLFLLTLVVIGGLGSRAGVVVAAARCTGCSTSCSARPFGTDVAGWVVFGSALLLMFTIAQHPTGLAGAVREARDRRRRAVRPRLWCEARRSATPQMVDLPRPTGLPERGPGPDRRPPAGGATTSPSTSAGCGRSTTCRSRSPQGRIVGLIGPNGAGKTTLFNAISGALRPDSGTVELLGQDLSGTPAHVRAAAGIGRTFQMIGLAKDLSVDENLLLAQHQVAGYGPLEALAGLGRGPGVEAELRAAGCRRDRGRSASSATPTRRSRTSRTDSSASSRSAARW